MAGRWLGHGPGGGRTGSALLLAPSPAGVVAGLGFGVLGVLLYSAPRAIGDLSLPFPILGLVPVFLWGLTNPGVRAVLATFALGLISDTLRDDPLGVWTLGYLAAYAAAGAQHRVLAGQSRGAVVIGFGVSALAFGIAASIAMAISVGAAPAVNRLVLDLAVTVVVSPLLALVFGGLERAALIAGEQL